MTLHSVLLQELLTAVSSLSRLCDMHVDDVGGEVIEIRRCATFRFRPLTLQVWVPPTKPTPLKPHLGFHIIDVI
jgi:hypothetical protein